MSRPPPKGLGLHHLHRSAETFQMLADMEEDIKVPLAFAMYGLYRTVQCLRQSAHKSVNIGHLLKLRTRRATDGCRWRDYS